MGIVAAQGGRRRVGYDEAMTPRADGRSENKKGTQGVRSFHLHCPHGLVYTYSEKDLACCAVPCVAHPWPLCTQSVEMATLISLTL